jgi:hypothetical protein
VRGHAQLPDGRPAHAPAKIVDHIILLKRGGPDALDNMQSQIKEEAKAKDRVE